ncbi:MULTISPECIES: prepilin-type N-terminal cleavage/methylation domain-containing protein [Pseudomonas]|uniref:Prepilin-type N-terminal cleavage/methylation domain-containing protein n=2 Tax=Pseudomonas poae TaxID=200451 RepID=A0AAP2S0Y5_9PSED|nr:MULTISPECIES: GspH/FimT family pseudopilin [Pseudomonas]KTC32999.1 general secretion pathway protein GspH [Pseudomonas sp. ABAC21]AGE25201.1 general secretion pathway protein H [Pseudomonas poae RE*1-1-14]KRP50073.1 general secretion pathway protein GspH [Pseudomonas poae]MCF5655539.1 prepilin-type N-terminal cleavage/methylation domain-containing protein [Pseudomonas poae]NMZ50328.1 prepilin-type N-terminal cleavage/methylation domain-containing protein [Pseudomonas poae]
MPNLQRGFTLLEMLVVIVLISIAAGLVGFGLQQGLRAAKERQVVGQMVEALRSTRARAIVSGTAQHTVFDLRRLSFAAPGRPTKYWPAALQVTLHTAEQAGSTVEFYPDGSSTGGNLLLANGTRRWRIDIGWLTGSVQSRALP